VTWAPGEPPIIEDRVVNQGGWLMKPGAKVFNLYLGPVITHGDATKAGPWLELLHALYPDDSQRILWFLAHRVQRPHEKINHGLVLGGKQGIGKDTLLETIRYAVGPWNFQEVSPGNLLGRFNPFVKSVVLRVSEARDLGDLDHILRAHEGLHGQPARGAPLRREEHPGARRIQCLRRCDDHQPQNARHLSPRR
jgi:hypothetical protein